MPSVKNLILVEGPVLLSNRTEYPTNEAGDAVPRGDPISSATRLASEVAATRRGSVIAIHPPTEVPSTILFRLHHGSLSRNCGTWVDFPEPVSPTSSRVS